MQKKIHLHNDCVSLGKDFFWNVLVDIYVVIHKLMEFGFDFQEAKKVAALTKSYNLLSTCVEVREADTFKKMEVELIRKFIKSQIEDFRNGLVYC